MRDLVASKVKCSNEGRGSVMTWNQDDGYLYHYTSASGLLGILRSRSIWATDSGYLNDGADCRLMDSRLQSYVGKGSFVRTSFPGSQRHRDALDEHMRRGRRTLVASFSRIPNSLTQFRMYAPDDGGFVIGFPRQALEKAGRLVDVNYNDREQWDWCDSFVKRFCAAVDQCDDGAMSLQNLSLAADAGASLLNERIEEGIRCKSSEFAQEEEVRVICHAGEIKLRASRRGNVLIPYVELPLPSEHMMVKVAAGPGPYQNSIAQQGLSYLPQALGDCLGDWSIGVMSIGQSNHRIGF